MYEGNRAAEYDYKAGQDYTLQKSQGRTEIWDATLPDSQNMTSGDGLSSLIGLTKGDDRDFVSGMIADKSRLAKGAVNNLQSMIFERLKMRDVNMANIDYDSCRAMTMVHEVDQRNGMGSDRQRQTLYMTLFGLEREKRMEDVSCWRDVSRLRQDFVEVAAAYVSAVRRERLFRDQSYIDT